MNRTAILLEINLAHSAGFRRQHLQQPECPSAQALPVVDLYGPSTTLLPGSCLLRVVLDLDCRRFAFVRYPFTTVQPVNTFASSVTSFWV